MTLSTSFRNSTRVALGAAIVVVAASAAFAVNDDTSDDVKQLEAKGALVPSRIKRGGSARADVAVKVTKGFHIQAHKGLDDSYIATTLTWDKPRPGIRAGTPDFPRPVLRKTAFDDRPLPMLEGAFVVRTRVTVARTVPPGTYYLKGKLHYQACSEDACFAPSTEEVTIPVVVVR